MANVQLFAKLDANLFLNPKVCELGDRNPHAAWVWVKAITYSVSQRTDGYVGDYVWRTFLAANDDDLTDLQQARMIEPADGGYRIHDYLDVQMSAEEQAAIRERRAKAGQRGGRSRAGRKPKDTREDDAQANAKQVLSTCLDDVSTLSKQTQADIDIDKDKDIDIDIYPPYSPPTGDESDGFAEAWETYPKHTGSRRSAHDAYTDTLTRIDADSLHTAVRRYARNSPDRKWTPTFRNWLISEQWREWAPKHDPQPKPAAPHRHTATCRHVLAHMNPVRDQYPARTDGLGPSPEYAAACQQYADQLNKEEQSC